MPEVLVTGGELSSMKPFRDASSAALEKVVRRYETQVRAIAQQFGVPSAEWDELFQDVRIRLWKALEDPERIRTASASYIHRTATSAAVDLLRRKRRSLSHVPLHPEVAVTTLSNPGIDQEARETAEEISRAMDQLDDRRRPVVRMYLAGYNHREIADLLGWSPGATRNLLYRGLADLRRKLSSCSETES